MSETGDQNGPHFDTIARGVYLEGLAFDAGRDLIWYSDVIAGGIHAVRRDGAAVYTLNPERRWTGGIAMNHDGAVLSSGPGGIMWNRPEEGTSGWLLDGIADAPFSGVNEMVSDGHGGLYFGTVDIERIEQGEPTRPAALYRLTAARELTLVAGSLGFANGIMRSPDGTRLYYNDTFDATYVFDILDDGSLSERRRLLAKEDCDGMALDRDGNLLITGYKSGEIARLSPNGTPLDPIPVGQGAITQLRFGGGDMRDIYMNSVPLDAGDGLKVGDSPTAARSLLLHGRAEIPGLPLLPARFDL